MNTRATAIAPATPATKYHTSRVIQLISDQMYPKDEDKLALLASKKNTDESALAALTLKQFFNDLAPRGEVTEQDFATVRSILQSRIAQAKTCHYRYASQAPLYIKLDEAMGAVEAKLSTLPPAPVRAHRHSDEPRRSMTLSFEPAANSSATTRSHVDALSAQSTLAPNLFTDEQHNEYSRIGDALKTPALRQLVGFPETLEALAALDDKSVQRIITTATDMCLLANNKIFEVRLKELYAATRSNKQVTR